LSRTPRLPNLIEIFDLYAKTQPETACALLPVVRGMKETAPSI
jgi:hypothetical protein